MFNRPLAERDRYSLVRPLALEFWHMVRTMAALAVMVYIVLEPDHKLARAMLEACKSALTYIASL